MYVRAGRPVFARPCVGVHKSTSLMSSSLLLQQCQIPYVIECRKCKKVYIGSTQALNTRISQHKCNIMLPENRKLYASKHLHKCSNGLFKMMPMYQTDDYTLLQRKEKKFHKKFKQTLNRTCLYTPKTSTHARTRTHNPSGR